MNPPADAFGIMVSDSRVERAAAADDDAGQWIKSGHAADGVKGRVGVGIGPGKGLVVGAGGRHTGHSTGNEGPF